jgi:hypothetical protein
VYVWLRRVHRAAGLFSATFLAAYALSAAQMAYPIYRPQPAVTAFDIGTPSEIDATPRAVARWLGDSQGLRGELRDVESDGNGFAITVATIGTTHRVQFDAASRTLHVITRRQNAVGMLNRIHHVRGIDHDSGALNAWGWLLASASVLLLVLATSGIVMWFARHAERVTGAIVLGVGLAWGLTLLILMRAA